MVLLGISDYCTMDNNSHHPIGEIDEIEIEMRKTL